MLGEAHIALSVSAITAGTTIRPCGVSNVGNYAPWARGLLGCAIALPVGGLGLLHTDIDVLGIVEVVLVECIVFEGGAD